MMLQNVLFEGNAYDISHFVTRQAIGILRPVSSRIIIVLNNSTTIQPVPLEATMIPMHKFEIIELGELFNMPALLAGDVPLETSIGKFVLLAYFTLMYLFNTTHIHI